MTLQRGAPNVRDEKAANRPGAATLTRCVSYVIMLAGTFCIAVYLFFPERFGHLFSTLEGALTFFGGFSSGAAALSLTFWVARKAAIRSGQRGFEDFGLARRWVGFLREHHTIFGWTAFVAATAHALYFLSDSPALTAHAVTGWVAWAVMTILVAAGLLLKRASGAGDESGNVRAKRRVHGALAILFVVALSLHTAFPVTVLALWVCLAIPTAVVWRKRRFHRTISERDNDPRPSDGTAGKERR